MLVRLGLATTTAVGMVDGIHSHTTDLGTTTEPAASAGFAKTGVLVVLVAHGADSSAAVDRHHTHFAARQTHLRMRVLLRQVGVLVRLDVFAQRGECHELAERACRAHELGRAQRQERNGMDGRADGNHAQREHIARPDGLRTEDTEIDGIVAVLLLLVLHHMAVALHGIACYESIRSKNVTQTLCLAVLNQRNVGAASGVVLNAHDLLLTRLPAVKVDEAQAGDIVAIAGVQDLSISDTVCALDTPEALPALTVDEPTISMTFQVNNSPFAGSKEHSGGKFITSRQIRERLERETLHNVALKVEETQDADKFLVSGRGELHLSVLIENMRREGYELAVSRPEVIIKEIDGQLMEPVEQLVVDVEEQHQGGVMEKLGIRKGQLKNMEPDGKGRVRLDYMIPARGLIGFQNEFKTLTQGSGLLFHVFDHYGPKETGAIAKRNNGVMIANAPGMTPAYSLGPLEERGRLFAAEGDNVYEGQLVGIHSKDNDLTVNVIKGKPLTNVRASGKDDAIKLTPALKYTLEQALDFIEDDELVEVTPKEIRLRKKLLTESDRKRASRAA